MTPRRPPGLLLFCSILLCVVVMALAIWTALRQPWLGITALPDAASGGIVVAAVASDGPAGAAPVPARLMRLDELLPIAEDLIEEPDMLPDYRAVAAFMERQDALAAQLAGETVTLTTLPRAGEETTIVVAPQTRPPGDLPAAFWVQLLTGVGGFMIGCWVWALRPRDWGTRMFALSGLGMLTFTTAAAIYSTRELALPADLFRLLSGLNVAGANIFGMAMIALFLCYPRRLVPPAALLVIPAVFVPWTAADLLRLTSGPASSHLETLVEMILIVVAIIAQAWATRRDPRARAALRWLGLSVILGAGAFVATMAAPPLLGGLPPLSQGYAFVFFLLIYAGLALGLRRYRLFELGEWAFRIMFYMGGLLLLLALDALLILGLNLEQAPSLGLSLLAVGFAYLPLRDLLWRRLVARRRLHDHELFQAVIDVAFAGSAEARARRWRALAARLFDPLEITALDPAAAPARPAVREDGVELLLPATADAPPLALRYPWGGRGLFGPVHLNVATQLATLMAHADSGRDAYERGAAEERRRIAQDLHDDVGARLLSGLHHTELSQTRQTLRDAIADVRSIVGGLAGDRLPLSRVLAEMRHETAQRLEAAGIALDWPLGPADEVQTPLDYRIYKNLRSALREIVSNAIRHAGAQRITVESAMAAGSLELRVADDGRGIAGATAGDGDGTGSRSTRRGAGLGNIEARLASVGGEITFPPVASGTEVRLSLPLDAGEGAIGADPLPGLIR